MKPPQPPEKPLVSIVIPTYHRNKDLVRLLKSVKASDYPAKSIEIIIIDNANDPALKLAARLAWPDAHIIASPKNLYSNGARRVGVAAAHGEYVYLLDDDNTMETDCLDKLIDAHRP
jgi:GT2 family glycosyltransferase